MVAGIIQPAAAQRLVERHRRLQALQFDLPQLILRFRQIALRIQHCHQIFGTDPIADFR